MGNSNRPPRTLAEVTRSMRERNDMHERNDSKGIPKERGQVHVTQLASTIARDNAMRSSRIFEEELEESARKEVLLACDMIEKEVDFQSKEHPDMAGFFDTMLMFENAVREFLNAQGAKTNTKKSSALQAMHEAIASLERTRTQ